MQKARRREECGVLGAVDVGGVRARAEVDVGLGNLRAVVRCGAEADKGKGEGKRGERHDDVWEKHGKMKTVRVGHRTNHPYSPCSSSDQHEVTHVLSWPPAVH